MDLTGDCGADRDPAHHGSGDKRGRANRPGNPGGWHQLAIALRLFGPECRIFAWIGRTEIIPEIVMDAPTTLVWEHENGVRVVVDITFAVDTFFNSTHYGGDERIEVTGSKGYVRCNRISAQGIQEPSVEV